MINGGLLTWCLVVRASLVYPEQSRRNPRSDARRLSLGRGFSIGGEGKRNPTCT